jgi:hypothetical protein
MMMTGGAYVKRRSFGRAIKSYVPADGYDPLK